MLDHFFRRHRSQQLLHQTQNPIPQCKEEPLSIFDPNLEALSLVDTSGEKFLQEKSNWSNLRAGS